MVGERHAKCHGCHFLHRRLPPRRNAGRDGLQLAASPPPHFLPTQRQQQLLARELLRQRCHGVCHRRNVRRLHNNQKPAA